MPGVPILSPPEGAFEDNNWLPLTPYDSASIMNYPQCNSTTTQMEMTARDKQGAALVYGASTAPPPPSPGTPRTDTTSGSVGTGQMVQLAPVQVLPGTVFRASLTGTGDADLYVRWGAAPTTSAYTCRPFTGTSVETCELSVPANVTQAFVAVRGYAAQSTYTLTRTWFAP
jgi:serine protease